MQGGAKSRDHGQLPTPQSQRPSDAGRDVTNGRIKVSTNDNYSEAEGGRHTILFMVVSTKLVFRGRGGIPTAWRYGSPEALAALAAPTVLGKGLD